MAHKVKLHGTWVTVQNRPRMRLKTRRPIARVNWIRAAIRGDIGKLKRRPG